MEKLEKENNLHFLSGRICAKGSVSRQKWPLETPLIAQASCDLEIRSQCFEGSERLKSKELNIGLYVTAWEQVFLSAMIVFRGISSEEKLWKSVVFYPTTVKNSVSLQHQPELHRLVWKVCFIPLWTKSYMYVTAVKENLMNPLKAVWKLLLELKVILQPSQSFRGFSNITWLSLSFRVETLSVCS